MSKLYDATHEVLLDVLDFLEGQSAVSGDSGDVALQLSHDIEWLLRQIAQDQAEQEASWKRDSAIFDAPDDGEGL